MIRNLITAAVVLCGLLLSLPASAALDSVSGQDPLTGNLIPVTVLDGPAPANIAVNLANGFPLYYRDTPTGLKLELCQETNGFCLLENPFVGQPIQFPLNFGPEAFWWATEASMTFDPAGPAGVGNALLVTALEAAFSIGFPAENLQAAFSRIRLRIGVSNPGTYRVTHPFGQATYEVVETALIRDINETQDQGNLAALFGPTGDFTVALNDGPVAPEIAGEAVPIVDTLDRSIGPFLTWDTFNPDPLSTDPALIDAAGNRYVGDPGPVLTPLLHSIIGSPVVDAPLNTNATAHVSGFQNVFRIEKETEPDTGTFELVAETDQFAVMGKIFNDGANLPPIALPDFGAVAMDQPGDIDLLRNDIDPLAIDNVHSINPQAIAVGAAGSFGLQSIYSGRFTTADGGVASRQTNFATGEGFLRYNPAAGFSGKDIFEYQLQDTGGLLSIPAAITVLVEDLALSQATLRPKQMKWLLSGTSNLSDLTGSDNLSLYTRLLGGLEVPAVNSAASGMATLAIAPDLASFALELSATGLLSAMTAAHIHIGAPGVVGPPVVDLAPLLAANPLITDSTLLSIEPNPLVSTMAQVISEIQAGNAYINVHTTDHPTGEIRGQIGKNMIVVHAGADLTGPVIGAAAVSPQPVGSVGSWALIGKSTASPGTTRTLSLQSSAGVSKLDLPLQLQ